MLAGVADDEEQGGGGLVRPALSTHYPSPSPSLATLPMLDGYRTSDNKCQSWTTWKDGVLRQQRCRLKDDLSERVAQVFLSDTFSSFSTHPICFLLLYRRQRRQISIHASPIFEFLQHPLPLLFL